MAGEVSKIKWEEPPQGFDEVAQETRRRFVSELMDNPNSWGIIAVYEPDGKEAAKTYAGLVRRGQLFWKDEEHGGTFEATVGPENTDNPDESKHNLYVRYVPAEEASAPQPRGRRR